MAIYIIRGTVTGHVKIGYSGNVERRLQNIQTACSEPIELLEVCPLGDRSTERRLHRQFRWYRIHGEWFKPEGDMWAWVARLKDKINRKNLEAMRHGWL